MRRSYKTFRVLETFLRLYEQSPQDATEPSGEQESTSDDVQSVSSAEKSLIKVLSKAFSYVPKDVDKVVIQKLKSFLDNASSLTMRQVIDIVKTRLPISNQDMIFQTNTNTETPLSAEGEKYYANLIARSFMYKPTDEEIKIIDGMDQQFSDDDPHQISETIETLLDVSAQGLESALDNFPKK